MIKKTKLSRKMTCNRVDYLLKICRGKKVLHVGCSDSPFHKERHEAGSLLHEQLSCVTGELWGIDNDMDSINWLLANTAMTNLIISDAESVDLTDLYNKFDVVLATELIEHLSNPGTALTGFMKYLLPDGKLVVTVPNAFSFRNLVNTLFGIEKVHSQHVMWFSYATLKVLLQRSGYSEIKVRPYQTKVREGLPMIYDICVHIMHLVSPWFSEGLIGLAGTSKTENVSNDKH